MNYKLALVAATAMLITSSAYAEGNRIRTSSFSNANAAAAAQSRSNSASRSSSTSSGGNGGNASQNNTNNSSFQDRKQAPGIGIPGLTSGAVTCLGSVSAGFSVAGFGGGLGSTYLERNCESRAAADQIYHYGYRRAAIQLLINEHPMVNRAMVMTGNARPIHKGK